MADTIDLLERKKREIGKLPYSDHDRNVKELSVNLLKGGLTETEANQLANIVGNIIDLASQSVYRSTEEEKKYLDFIVDSVKTLLESIEEEYAEQRAMRDTVE